MSFKEVRDLLIEAENQAIADWEARANDWMRGPPSIEARLSFMDFRRQILAGVIAEILNELIAWEDRDAHAERRVRAMCPGAFGEEG